MLRKTQLYRCKNDQCLIIWESLKNVTATTRKSIEYLHKLGWTCFSKRDQIHDCKSKMKSEM